MENQNNQKITYQMEKKRQIMESAIRLFKTNGFYNVSIEEIVKEADLSIGSFYNYFSSKDELVISYRRELFTNCHYFYNELKQNSAHAENNSLDKLEAFIFFILDLLAELGEEFGRVFVTHRIKDTDALPEDKPYYPLIIELIEIGQIDKSIRQDYTEKDIADIIDMFIIGCHIEWLVNRGTYEIKDSATKALEVLFKNISYDAQKQKIKQTPLGNIWIEAISRTVKDFRSDIKNLEDQWLERF